MKSILTNNNGGSVNARSKLIYLSFLIIFTILILITSTSFAYLRKEIDTDKKITITVGTLDYTIESADLENNKITILANTNKEILIKVTSNNQVDSKYELYYNFITELSKEEKASIRITETPLIEDIESKIIGKNATVGIGIMIENNLNKSVEIEIGIQGGLINNDVELTENKNQIDIDLNSAFYQYTNSEYPEYTTVKKTLDYLYEVLGE